MIRLKKSAKGFTLIEMMLVIAIIGVLAAIAIPNFVSFRKRAHNGAALADARNAFTAAQAYYSESNSGNVDLDQIKSYGFVQSKGVNVTCVGLQPDLVITATHISGNTNYSVDFEGAITTF